MAVQAGTPAKQSTLCWECEWAAGKEHKCPWANKFEPVPGWKAEPTKILIGGDKVKYIDSFIVYECLMFEEMTEIKRQRAENAKKAESRKSVLQDKDKTFDLVERLWIDEHKTAEEIVSETGLPLWRVYVITKKIKENRNGK